MKEAGGRYPTRDGQRVWWKVTAKATLDMVAIGYTGPSTAPTALVLAFPDDVDGEGQRRTAGATTVLTKAAARLVSPLLQPTGATFDRTLVWGSRSTSTVTVIEPLVVEVSTDASAETGVLRHAARLQRVRPDLDVADLDE